MFFFHFHIKVQGLFHVPELCLRFNDADPGLVPLGDTEHLCQKLRGFD